MFVQRQCIYLNYLLSTNLTDFYFLFQIRLDKELDKEWNSAGFLVSGILLPSILSICRNCTLYTVYCIIHCTSYSIHYTLYIVYTLYTVHCTLYTVHCTLNFIHCTLYTLYCTLYSILLYTTTTLNTKYSCACCTLQCCSILYMHWH